VLAGTWPSARRALVPVLLAAVAMTLMVVPAAGLQALGRAATIVRVRVVELVATGLVCALVSPRFGAAGVAWALAAVAWLVCGLIWVSWVRGFADRLVERRALQPTVAQAAGTSPAQSFPRVEYDRFW
jgi:O-antigen/teichoic acid export membrane protein